jgi:hypothetical protein
LVNEVLADHGRAKRIRNTARLNLERPGPRFAASGVKITNLQMDR